MGGGLRLASAEATQISLDTLEGSSDDVAADTNRHTDDNRVYVYLPIMSLLSVCFQVCVSDILLTVCVHVCECVCVCTCVFLCVGIQAFFGACRVDVMQLLLLLGLDILILLHSAGVLQVAPVGGQSHQEVDLRKTRSGEEMIRYQSD